MKGKEREVGEGGEWGECVGEGECGRGGEWSYANLNDQWALGFNETCRNMHVSY